MSQRAIREYDGKRILANWIDKSDVNFQRHQLIQVNESTDLKLLPTLPGNEWLNTSKLVVKPDQLIKRRGKSGLIKLNCTYDEVCQWLDEYRNKEVQVEQAHGILNTFIIESFVPHEQSDEYYLCIQTQRHGDLVMFYHEGGVNVGDVDSKANKFLCPLDGKSIKEDDIIKNLLNHVKDINRQQILSKFIYSLIQVFQNLQFSYLEINPLVLTNDNKLHILDLAAKIDETAHFECSKQWGYLEFPPPFGRALTAEEAFVKELDGKTGASLKLTILNPDGRIWLMVAGGGASVIYADTVSDAGMGHELANYGEYSGAPTTAQTYDYARTILGLMTKKYDPRGKVLLIGGGIANFTDIASTFKGIIKALTEYKDAIKTHHIKILVRRAGPNYQEGLELMRQTAIKLNIDMQVYGPELHMTSIVPMALNLKVDSYNPKYIPKLSVKKSPSLMNITNRERNIDENVNQENINNDDINDEHIYINNLEEEKLNSYNISTYNDTSQLFTPNTQAFVYGLQVTAVQNMLDFDFICGRKTPSVAALIYPFSDSHYQKFYWNSKEILIPCVQSVKEAMQKFPNVDCVINFASFRSVYESTNEIMDYPQIKTIAIIAEGVPERRSRLLIERAKKQNITIIGPATVGGIKPGCFRIGNTGGMLDNIIHSRLYRPGSIAYVTRSGGMSNELNNIINQNSDGVYEGVAIGGDRFPGTTFIDHLLRYQKNDAIKILIVLGEVGGVEEYEICKLIKNKTITKPIIAWCIGTCAKIFPYDVQFGHAGACAHGQVETADAKNNALREAGAIVPESFDKFGVTLNQVYCKLIDSGKLKIKREIPQPTIPVDFAWANKLGLIRKPASFISSISDERGEELTYGNMKISDIINSDMGIGGVIGLLWFRRKLPQYFCTFIELILQLTADHGPAVSGAHNTIVCARAGKDLISSLCSGLLTIGPRFGGALDDAARKFSEAYDAGLTPDEFIESMRKKKELIPGIGHKIKSLEDPDKRVAMVKDFVVKNFKSTELFNFACNVELLTTKKKSNLILNVDGVVAVAFVDLLRSCGAFSLDEANNYIEMGILNGLFVVGRSIGFIGHWIDQNRLKQPLYRHPTDDISYITELN